MMIRLACLLCIGLLSLGRSVGAEDLFRPRTLLGGEYWAAPPEEGYLDYLEAVRPDLIQAGLLGPELAGSITTKGEKVGITQVYPPVGTIKEYLDWWRTFNAEAHKRGVKVQTTYSLTYVWGDKDKHTGFFKYYDDQWETEVLGPKPAPAADAFLRTDAEGNLVRDAYGDWFTYAGCLNNPVWRQLQKQMVKTGVDAGFDGFMVQFPYDDHRCVCAHCQEKFKRLLSEHFTLKQLSADCGITNLATHVFPMIGSPDGKYPKLELAAREFGAICVKDCFDDIFVDYGRSLNPDLVLSLWTHFRRFVTEDATNVSFTDYLDERTLLPMERWGKGENYVWYSSPMSTSDLTNGIAGDSALDGRVLRALAGDTAFEILKYDYYRWRLVTGESLALGGICFGAWDGGKPGNTDHETPHHFQTYYRFVREHDAYLDPRKRESHADVALLYPRQALFAGDATFFAPFRNVGRALLRGHVLFDVLIDQKLTAADLAKRRAVVVFAPEYLTLQQGALLKAYAGDGGKVVFGSGGQNSQTLASTTGFDIVDGTDRVATMQALAAVAGTGFSTFDAPWTVEVTADRQPAEKRVLLHLVNYNRDESQPGKELPLAAGAVAADLLLPADFKVRSVTFLTPEVKDPTPVRYRQRGDRVRFTTPGFLVYGLVVVQGK